MTLRELFSEWSNPKELRKGVILSGVICVVFVILYFFDAEKDNRGYLYGALALAILNVACWIRLLVINKNK